MMTKYEDLQEHLKSNQYTWLVTGVAGFVGSNLLEKLLTLNQKVIGLDNFETGYKHNIVQALEDAKTVLKSEGLELASENFKLIDGDIRKLDDCHLACNEVDFVLHQAALGSVPRSIENPIHTNKANIDGYLNMLVAARDAKVKRFVYAASSSTYGDSQALPKVEDTIGKPLSPYAVTKYVNELYADVFGKTYDTDVIGFRYFNVFGPKQSPDGAYAAVIPLFMQALKDEKSPKINGDGEQTRDFTFIDNVVQANVRGFFASKAAKNEVFNIACGERITINYLWDSLKTAANSNVDAIHGPNRQGDVRDSLADVSKARKLLGYEPKYTVREGLGITWDSFI